MLKPVHGLEKNLRENLGSACQRRREVEARTHFEKAVECDPDLAEPYMNLGLLAQNAGQARPAIDYYRKFLKKARPDKYGEYIPKVKAALAELEAKR